MKCKKVGALSRATCNLKIMEVNMNIQKYKKELEEILENETIMNENYNKEEKELEEIKNLKNEMKMET